jgi:hypothetical protein
MQQQHTEKVVVNLKAFRERQKPRTESAKEEVEPGPMATPLEKLAYHLLMAVRAAKELP